LIYLYALKLFYQFLTLIFYFFKLKLQFYLNLAFSILIIKLASKTKLYAIEFFNYLNLAYLYNFMKFFSVYSKDVFNDLKYFVFVFKVNYNSILKIVNHIIDFFIFIIIHNCFLTINFSFEFVKIIILK